MRARRFRGDEGAVTTEFVIATPLLLTFLMLIIQTGLYFHAVSVASAAAQEGARAATLEDETNRIAVGRAEATDFVTTLAPRLLLNPSVNGELVHSGEVVRITVDANVLEVFPFPFVVDWSVHEVSESVIERFRPSTEAPPTS